MNNLDLSNRIKENAFSCEKALSAKLDLIKNDKAYESFSILEESMRYSLMAGGKRLRPCLAMEFCRLCGGDAQMALDYACSVEMIHTSSLIHDDMPCMDNDELRRGKPTNHMVFGEATALLAGDTLIAYAFETIENKKLSDKQNFLASKTLARLMGACGMCAGQQIDLQSEGKKIDANTLETLHEKKTGALIKCACLLGCIAAGKFEDSKQWEDACLYAEKIGLAFQIADDILDVSGDEAKLGKKCGSDEKEEKNTYVTLYGLEKAKEMAKKLCDEAKDIIGKYEGSDFLVALADFIVYREN